MSTVCEEPLPASWEDSQVSSCPPPGRLPPRTFGLWQIGSLCLFAALVMSTWDVAWLALRRFVWHQFLFANDHIFWTTTAVHVATFLIVGVPMMISARTSGSFATVRFTTFLLVFVAAWSAISPWPGLHPTAEVLLSVGIAAQLSRAADRYSAKLTHLAKRAWPALAVIHLLIAGFVVANTHQREALALAALPATHESRPNVLLVVLDTVRFDALSLGIENDREFPQADTPNLRRLAERGVNFRRAVSTASWTLPAHAGMFTGHFTDAHRATWHRPPQPELTTLAERLSDHGYLTGGFVGNTIYCSRETGLAKGFVRYEDYPLTWTRILQSTPLGRYVLQTLKARRIDRVERKRAPQVTEPFFAWLDAHAMKDRPFFAFLNYFDAHDPYVPPKDFAEAVPTEEPDRVAIRDWWHIDKHTLTDQQVALGLRGYLDCIRYLDHHFGEVLARLHQRGVLENTIVVVTADHGEHFGDHMLFGHGNSLYEPLVNVPLIVSWPGHVPRQAIVDDYVSVADLPVTVCDLIGIDRAALPGASLARYWNDSTTASRDERLVRSELTGPSIFPPNHGESPIFNGPMRAVYSGSMKYIRAGETVELYDLASDPHEERNLVDLSEYADMLQQLRDEP